MLLSAENIRKMDDNTLQGFFKELSQKEEVKTVGQTVKKIYDLIQTRKSVLQGSQNSLGEKAALLHNWMLYSYGNKSLVDKNVEIIQRIVNGNIEDLNTLENTLHIYNRNRGIREVDELLDTLMYNTGKTHYTKNVVVPTGDIQSLAIHIDKNRVGQNNRTDPANPLMIIPPRGLRMTTVVHPRKQTLLEQIDGVENMLKMSLDPSRAPEKENRTDIGVKILERDKMI